jgi:threonine dehydrogenase-like Zn-dependent dehydrogenase
MFEGPHDVRIRMKAVGICGSDVHYLKVDIDIVTVTSDFNIQQKKYIRFQFPR